MAPSRGERGGARQRRAEEARRQAEEQARRRRRRTVVGVVVGAVAVVALLVAVVLTVGAGDDEPTAAPTDPATAFETTPPPTDAENPCSVPAVEASEPLQFPAAPEPGSSTATSAVVTTSCGDITVELEPDAAPQAVASFDFLAGEGYFDGTACHRLVTTGIFVLQCGDPTGTGGGGPGYSFGPVENAPADDVYPAGTLAMARVGDDGESNGSQFFLVYEDSTIPSDTAGGYTVFGRITEGLDIVQTIAAGGTQPGSEAPARPITIEGVTTQ